MFVSASDSMRGRVLRAGTALALTFGAWACSAETGNDAPQAEETTASTAAAVTGTSCQAIDIAAHSTGTGGDTTFAIKTDGTVWGWGWNKAPYPLGFGSPNLPYTDKVATPILIQGVVPAPATNPAVQLAIHSYGGCARLKDGHVSCWGQPLGNTDLNSPPPQAALVQMDNQGTPGDLLVGAVGITAGNAHACAWNANGDAWCWGDDTLGQLGDIAYAYSANGQTVAGAVPMSGANHIIQVVAAASTTCVLTGPAATAPTLPNQIYCTGGNYYGELGQTDSPTPGELSLVTGTSGLAFGSLTAGGGASGDATFCATTIKTTGGVQQTYCWGDNIQGQATIAAATSLNQTIFAPKLVDSDVGSQWALGDGNGCEVTAAGVLSCWGMNTNAQFPGVSMAQVTTKTAIPGLVNSASTFSNAVLKVTVGPTHLCALTASALYCWGNNADGEIGAGSSGGTQPARSIHLSDATVTCGTRCGPMTDSCGVTTDCGDCGDGYVCALGKCKALPKCHSPAQCCAQAGGYWDGKYCE